MDNLVKEFVNNGKNANEVLEMPFHYVLGILEDQNKAKKVDSLISAFGG